MTSLRILNFLLIGATVICMALSLNAFSHKVEQISIPMPKTISNALPKNPFILSDSSYQSIEDGPFALHWQAPQMQLPDLRQELMFLSKNCRPDNPKGKPLIHIGLRSSNETVAFYEKQRIYLVYKGSNKINPEGFHTVQTADTSQKVPFTRSVEYVFSPDNQPTPLWCEFKESDSQDALEMRVFLIDEKGSLVVFPQEFAAFTLRLQDNQKIQFFNCEIGGYRADPSLLVRQKARWLGKDVFFETHGDGEYCSFFGKERIDFLSEKSPYSCFVSAGDFLVWDGQRWRLPSKGENTLQMPLLVVQKIEEKLMSLELWDPEGKGKIMLNLIRGHDMQGFPNMEHEFKFVGAKTWAQFIVDCQGKRMTIRLNEWLLLTPDGWVKLETPKDVDDYVEQRTSGTLFVVDSLEKENGRQCLIGHMFNNSRTEMQKVKIPSSAPPGQIRPFPLPAPLSQNQVIFPAEDD